MTKKKDFKYKFTETWFEPFIPSWEKIFKAFKGDVKNVLEIGCYEGRATTWICENVLATGANYDVVDTFGGSDESGMVGTESRLKDSNFIYDNFVHNISNFNGLINFSIHEGYSNRILPKLCQELKYELVYVDASHRSDDTFVDSYYAHKALKPGGMIIFDDYGWKDLNKSRDVDSPEKGINFFYNMYKDKYELFFHGYQVGFIKK
jgi:hypothetical protein